MGKSKERQEKLYQRLSKEESKRDRINREKQNKLFKIKEKEKNKPIRNGEKQKKRVQWFENQGGGQIKQKQAI